MKPTLPLPVVFMADVPAYLDPATSDFNTEGDLAQTSHITGQWTAPVGSSFSSVCFVWDPLHRTLSAALPEYVPGLQHG